MTQPTLSTPRPAFKPLQLEPLDALTDLFSLEASSLSATVSAKVASTPVAAVQDGQPRRLPIQDIDEDPAQPRSEFDLQALQQLAETIAQRGVRQPISVRPHPEQAGRWMLNFGARRLRASTLAGKTEIPAFVDTTADSYDQVIENEQREGLSSLELALFVQRRLVEGESQAEIARRLGKTRGYVTFIGALIDAPDWLLSLYRSHRCRGITELYALRKLHETWPDAVQTWLAGREHMGRAEVQALKDELSRASSAPPTPEPEPPLPLPLPFLPFLPFLPSVPLSLPVPPTDEGAGSAGAVVVAWSPIEPEARADGSSVRTAPTARTSATDLVTLSARYAGVDVTIDLCAVPEEADCVFVVNVHSGERSVVPAGRVQLLRISRAVTV